MRNTIFFATAVVLVMSAMISCTKSSLDKAEEASVYLPLEIGNYWVYNHYRIDGDGTETLLPQVDSIFIQRDTLIRGHRYWIMEEYNYPYSKKMIVRDSLKHMVNHKGEILFSETNFSDVLHSYYEIHQGDTLASIHFKMQQPDQQITVPAGVFNVLNYQGDLTRYYPDNSIESKLNNYYAPHVGKIISTYAFYGAHEMLIEKRLTHFYVQTSN